MVVGRHRAWRMAVRARIKIYFDGGYRPLPAGLEMAVVVQGQTFVQRGLGGGSGLEAEWRALLWAVALAEQQHIAQPLFLGDALGVIQQVQGLVQVPKQVLAHHQSLQDGRALPIAIRHVKRSHNLAGIALSKHHPR